MTRREHVQLVLLLGALTAFTPLSIDMYLPAFPAIERHFAAAPGAVEATLSVFFIGLAVGQAVLGPLADRYGRRLPLIAGILLYIAASVVAALAPDIATLTVARFFQAIGGCAGIVTARAMVRDLFAERESARVYSMLMLVMGAAPILAPMLGGQLLLIADWPAIFWAVAAFALACLVAVLLRLGETLPRERRARGGLVRAGRAYLALLRDREFMAFAVASGLLMSGLFAYIAGSPFVFINLYGVSPQQYGLLFGMNAFGIIAASQVNAWLLSRWSGRVLLRWATLVNLWATLAMLPVAILGLGGLAGLLAPLFVSIASRGFIGSNAMAAAMSRAGGNVGAASALTGVLQFALAGVAGGLVGLFQNASAVPMTAVMAGGAVSGWLVLRLARSREAQPG